MQPFHTATQRLLERLVERTERDGEFPLGIDEARAHLRTQELQASLYRLVDFRQSASLLEGEHFYVLALRSLCASYLLEIGDARALLARAADALDHAEATLETTRRALMAVVFEAFASKLEATPLDALRIPERLQTEPRLSEALAYCETGRLLALESQGRWREAATLAEKKATRLTGADRAILLMKLAAARWNLGEEEAAIAAFRASCETNPQRSKNLYRLTALATQIAFAELWRGPAARLLRREFRTVPCRKVGRRAFERRIERQLERSRQGAMTL